VTGLGGFRTLLAKEVLEQWRTLRLPIVAILFLFVGLSSPLLARYTAELVEALAGDQIAIPIPAPVTADAVDQLVRNLHQFGGLAAILLAMGAVAAEKDRGTAALLLTTPVTRGAFIGAKAIAIGATLALGTALATAAAWLYTALLFEPLPVAGSVGLAALIWLVLACYAALTFLASTVLRSPAAAGGLGFGAFLGLSIISALPRVGEYLPPALVGQAAAIALGETGGNIAGPVLVTIGVITGSLVLAWAAFRRQEL
jgi:ABC-2 type transport system permease protein